MTTENKKIRALILTTWGKHIGGAQTHIDLLVKCFREQGHDVKLFQINERWATLFLSMIAFPFSRGYSFSNFHNYIIRPFYFKYRLLLLKMHFTPQVIAAHDPFAVVIAQKAFPHTPIVQTVHGPLFEHAKEGGQKNNLVLNLLKRVELSAFNISDRIITVDSGQANLAEQKGAESTKITIIGNAVDQSELRILSDARPKTEFPDPYFIIARRLVPKNGVKYGILGFYKSEWRTRAKLLIAGDGDELASLQSLVKELGIEGKVDFLGSVPHKNIIPLIANARISIVPSVPFQGVVEATSLTALESLALGVPTIASNIGGLSEIDGGTNCLTLTPPADAEAIGNSINLLMADQELGKNKIMLGQARIAECFSTSVWFAKTCQVYAEVISSKK